MCGVERATHGLPWEQYWVPVCIMVLHQRPHRVYAETWGSLTELDSELASGAGPRAGRLPKRNLV